MTSGSQFLFSSESARSQPIDDKQRLHQPQQHVLEGLLVTVWQADEQGQIIFLSTRWQTLTGRPPIDSLKEAFWEAVALEGRDLSHQQWENICQQQRPFVMQLHLCQTDGTSHRVVVQGEPLRDNQDQVLGWIGTLQLAVTPLQSELDYSQNFLQAMLDNLSNGIVACDAQGILTVFNPAAQEQHELSLSPIPAEQWANYYNLYQVDGRTPLSQNEIPLYRAWQGESVHNAEIVIKPSQGPPRTILASGDPIIGQDGQNLGAVVATQDITLRKQAELKLRKSEERWQLALQGTGDGLFDWNIVTNEVFMSPQLKQTLGYADHEINNHFEGWRQLVHPDDLGEVAAAIEAHLQQRVPSYAAEYRMLCKDGGYKWILARGQTQWDDNGQPIRMIGSHQDVTRQKQAEMQLAQLNQDLEAQVISRTTQLMAANHQKETLRVQEQEARRQSGVARAGIELYENILWNIQIGFLVWHSPSPESMEILELVAANPAAESMLDMEFHEKIGDQMGAIFPKLVEKYPNILLSLVQVIRIQTPCFVENVTFTWPESQERIFYLKAFPLPDNCVGVTLENITVQRTNESCV